MTIEKNIDCVIIIIFHISSFIFHPFRHACKQISYFGGIISFISSKNYNNVVYSDNYV